MAAKKHEYREMPGFEGMGKGRTILMVVVVAVVAVVMLGMMVKGLDSAHGKVVVEAPSR